MQNRILKLLNIKYPIIQGGMAWSSDAGLAAAVSNAGGAGVIGFGSRNADWARAEIRKTKELTDKPFGVNIVIMMPGVQEIIQAVSEEKVAFATLGAGNPIPLIEPLKKAGIKVIPVVPNVKLAKRVEENGADALVVEGMEAGGHIGVQTTMSLLENVIPHIRKIPVIAAGGIADGRAVAAAFVMGAAAVQIGSRFLISEECPVHQNFKEAVLKATDTDSVVTGFSSHSGVRCLQNPFTDKYLALEVAGASQDELNTLATGTNRMAAVDGDIINGAMQVSQSLCCLNKIQPCEEIIEELMTDARNILNNARNIAI